MKDVNRPRAKKPAAEGYRVDIQINETGHYAPYTSKKMPVTREIAESLAAHLKRGDGLRNTGGRIVKVPEEQVVETWERKA